MSDDDGDGEEKGVRRTSLLRSSLICFSGYGSSDGSLYLSQLGDGAQARL